MALLKNFWKAIFSNESDEQFLKIIHIVERLVSKILSIALLIVIAVALFDLIYLLGKDISAKDPAGFYNRSIIELFGLFLNILIALELLENITAYLKKNIIHVELVIVTALIAVSRKIIIFDFAKQNSQDMIAISIGIFALSISYCLIKNMKIKQ
ncbi:phosphate-starvation-inducible PsiE family protein [Hyella patelloides]|uniref:phosphate-starvation-inducible PsiE family protein n=1 Tax=Hyella patelloides TaxID=1982969 RepID=UPI0011A7F449